jgi:hypothetical protein
LICAWVVNTSINIHNIKAQRSLENVEFPARMSLFTRSVIAFEFCLVIV